MIICNDNKVNDTKKFENKIKGEIKEDEEGSDGKQNDKNILSKSKSVKLTVDQGLYTDCQ